MKNQKNAPLSLLEIDDLEGGRKVVITNHDGTCYFDLLDGAESITPIAIHPAFNPLALGTLAEFLTSNKLQRAACALFQYLRERLDARVDRDPLFVIRALWFIAQKSDGLDYQPDTTVLAWAVASAETQGVAAARIHEHAHRYFDVAASDDE